jgi:hypothetical protein
MKKILYFSALFVMPFLAKATSHTVSNQPYLPAQFPGLQAAHDAAAAGDTLLVESTGISYGTLDVNKEIHIYGATSLTGEGPRINALTITGTACSGSSFQSLDIFACTTVPTADQAMDFVSFRRCNIGSVGIGTQGTASYHNWVFEGNVFSTVSGIASFNYNVNGGGLYGFTSATFKDNLFYSNISGVSNSLLDHNFFTNPNNGVTVNYAFNFCTLRNNIFYGVSSNDGGYSSNIVYLNNISFGGLTNTFPIGSNSNTGSGNMENVDPMLVNVPINQAYLTTFDFHLQSGSPALAAGYDNENLGVYYSTTTFRADGEPDIPVVRSVLIPGGNTVPAQGTFQITVNSVSHQ